MTSGELFNGHRPRGAFQGEGAGSAAKLHGFSMIQGIALRIVRPTLVRLGARFYYCELHAGCGYNHRASCDGSPIAFLKLARTFDLPGVHALCVDQDADAIAQLRTRIAGLRLPATFAVEVYAAPNGRALDRFRELITDRPGFAVGQIVVDPNGATEYAPPSGRSDAGSVPLTELVQFCADYPRMDVLINFAVTARLRWLGRQRLARRDALPRHLPDPEELLVLLHREHALIQDRPCGAGAKFVTLVYTNYRGKQTSRALGIHWLDSDDGQRILERCRLQPRALPPAEVDDDAPSCD